ncbi:MAG: toll/interleukin-1 receptor domain-containing protein, partial [Candidatus Thermoplasmatota archaeon]|nr:toll/interleukin-1 receptor domain-containing protein [Candidatus Thermoplasmatota archaeon]
VQGAIEDCDCFVVILTEESIKSPWVNQEIGYACAVEKIMLPVWVGNVRVHMSGMIAGIKGVKSQRKDFPKIADSILRFLIHHFSIDSFFVLCEECGDEVEWDLPHDDDMFRFTQKGEPMICKCDKCEHENEVSPLTLLTSSRSE